jgi:hypothetical protein
LSRSPMPNGHPVAEVAKNRRRDARRPGASYPGADQRWTWLPSMTLPARTGFARHLALVGEGRKRLCGETARSGWDASSVHWFHLSMTAARPASDPIAGAEASELLRSQRLRTTRKDLGNKKRLGQQDLSNAISGPQMVARRMPGCDVPLLAPLLDSPAVQKSASEAAVAAAGA